MVVVIPDPKIPTMGEFTLSVQKDMARALKRFPDQRAAPAATQRGYIAMAQSSA